MTTEELASSLVSQSCEEHPFTLIHEMDGAGGHVRVYMRQEDYLREKNCTQALFKAWGAMLDTIEQRARKGEKIPEWLMPALHEFRVQMDRIRGKGA